MKQIFTILMLVFCTTTYGQIANGGMETWRTYSSGSSTTLMAPNSWYANDSIVYALGPLVCSGCVLQKQTFQCDTAHSGSYCAKIMSRDMGGTIGVAEAQLCNAVIHINTTTFNEYLTGGTPVTTQPDSVTVWIRYIPIGGDTGAVDIKAVIAGAGAGGTDSVVGSGSDASLSGQNYVLSTPTWTKHKYLLTYSPTSAVPDHIQVTFHTSFTSQTTDSSTMYIDDAILYPPGTTGIPLFQKNEATCYPNPTGNILNIRTVNYKNTVAEIYTITGQQVLAKNLQQNITEMDISSLSNGIYYLHLRNVDNVIVYNTKIVKQQ